MISHNDCLRPSTWNMPNLWFRHNLFLYNIKFRHIKYKKKLIWKTYKTLFFMQLLLAFVYQWIARLFSPVISFSSISKYGHASIVSVLFLFFLNMFSMLIMYLTKNATGLSSYMSMQLLWKFLSTSTIEHSDHDTHKDFLFQNFPKLFFACFHSATPSCLTLLDCLKVH